MSKSDRYRGLRPNPHTLGVKPLEQGEVSRTIRVRAKAPVHAWLQQLQPKEIGDLLEAAHDRTRERAEP